MLFCLSASHKTAPFDILERLSTHSAPLAPVVIGAHERVRGSVVLSTCNRFEAYLDIDADAETVSDIGFTAAVTAVAEATGVTADELFTASVLRSGGDVAGHLFAVASGLESVVVGEGEIGGQVRRALDEAREQGTSTRELERLFQRATQAQKGVKNATALGRAGRSLVRLSLDLADSRIADWSAQRTVLIGTGSYAAATLAALRDRGVVDISVYSPSGRTAFATKHGLPMIASLPSAAAAADLVITCTSRETPVLDAAALEDGGFSGRVMIIDLGMPRNVSPDVQRLDGVTLLDLETIRLHAPLEELQATDAARAIVQDAANQFDLAGRQQAVQPAVVALRQHILDLTQAEVDRARARGDEKVEQALRHLASVLLHTPSSRAAQLAAEGRADEVFAAVETLFGLDVRPAAAVCPFGYTA